MEARGRASLNGVRGPGLHPATIALERLYALPARLSILSLGDLSC